MHDIRHIPIVIVEDDDGMRNSLEFLLDCHGYDVVAFPTPEALLAGSIPGGVGCFIFDVHLPGLSGLELYAKLRSAGKAHPVILITGRIDDRIRDDARALDAVAVIEKPFADDLLLAAVGKALGDVPR